LAIPTHAIKQMDPLDEQIDALIRGPQYAMPQAEKDAVLTPILRAQCRDLAERCPPYRRFLERLGGDPDAWAATADLPPLPVAMFKHFLLSAVPPERVVRELHSSSTTGQQPSRIVVDKTTAFRQSRALVSILKEHVGNRRRPFLVLDAADSVAAGDSLTARGAAIRGVGNFASQTVFAMSKDASGDLAPQWDAIENFFALHRGQPVLLFGFTFVVWTRFVLEAERRGLSFDAADATLLHSGGWKKLAAAVSKDEFNRRTAAVLGVEKGTDSEPASVPPTANAHREVPVPLFHPLIKGTGSEPTSESPVENGGREVPVPLIQRAAGCILDFYGMVEQVGTVFVDCPSGNKHAPAFADVLIRRPLSLRPVDVGETGIIEVLSALPTSYPGHALLTEDQGVLVGVDDCPCGRRGRYFPFTARVERAELRGCGDTFAQSREI
jgi:phenylacetate-coenzyme A ligase PaaK-like adenylate-forming protein